MEKIGSLIIDICQEADLNRRHEDFQSSALPTELSRLFFLTLTIVAD